MASVI